MKRFFNPLVTLYIMQPLVKGFSVFYFVLLPVFYAQKIINSAAIGYIGGLFILLVVIGAVIVANWLHSMQTKLLLQLSAATAIFASFLLLFGAAGHNVLFLLISFGLMGLANGTSMSGVNAYAAQVTTRGDRYKKFANLGMLMDLVRITFPILVSGAVLLGDTNLAVIFIILASIVFLLFSSTLSHSHPTEETITKSVETGIRNNKNFLYVLCMEFLDSFASSQLFVFLPLIFLAKGYSLQSSLLLQSFVFLGYLCGRVFVSFMAKRFNGVKAVAYAEFGMVAAIILLLAAGNLFLLYGLSFILGIFARGTSPAIKALAFDSLTETQMKKGTALHVVAGDSGSALGQLLFGFMIGWYGVNSPFIAAAFVAFLIGAVSILKPIKIHKVES